MSRTERGRITELFREVEAGWDVPADRLVEVVYDEVRALAHRTPRRMRETLCTTALAHEVVPRLGLLEEDWQSRLPSRAVFFGAVGEARHGVRP